MKIKNVNIAIIHGMGEQQVGYSKIFQTKVINSLNVRGFETDCVRFEEIFWADVLSEQEEKVFERANYSDDLTYRGMRKFFANALGDAIAYQPRVKSTSDSIEVYECIHNILDTSFERLYEADPNAPLVFIAHSLGTIIASNYIWDNQHSNYGLKEPLDKLTGFITCGSPLGIWTLRYKTLGNSITFPHKGLQAKYKEKAKWINLYDRDDVIAYPLKNINDGYKNNLTIEKEINVGRTLEHWNPMSHTGYLEDADFVSEVVEYLEFLMS